MHAKRPEDSNQYDDAESTRRYRATLLNVLATPPDHKTKRNPDASPKKRGRPPKVNREPTDADAER
jgi:hypothetical protein